MIRSGLLFKEVDEDVRLVVPKAMYSQIKRAHGKGHFAVAKTEDHQAIIKHDCYIRNLHPKVKKNNTVSITVY